MTTCTLGLDIGSTYLKALAVAEDGTELHTERRRTPWRSLPQGYTEMDAADLAHEVTDLVRSTVCALDGRPVTGVGISGMAEAGVLLDADDNVVRPIAAWFDPRGGAEIEALPPAVRAEFPGRTGLPVSALATVAKLLHLRGTGLSLTGLTWLNVPEYVALLLGGERHSELSLAARTGLLDQDTAAPWPAVFDALGVSTDLLPPFAAAGTSWGETSFDGVPSPLAGAVLTVAGHDHLVASVAAGTLSTDALYDSMGTAEALVRVLDHPLDAAARDRLARQGVNVVRHMLPGRATMLAGTRGGLVLRRVLSLVGVHDATGRARLDAAVMALPDRGGPAAGAIRVTGAWNHESELGVHAEADDLSPALLFAAALAHSTDVLTEVVARMEAEVAPAARTVVAGGWTGMDSVRRSRRLALPDVRFSVREEDTAFGAALVGAFAVSSQHDLTDFAGRFGADRPAPDPAPSTALRGPRP
jgi:sugar (pentulose or hexulose) kinase